MGFQRWELFVQGGEEFVQIGRGAGQLGGASGMAAKGGRDLYGDVRSAPRNTRGLVGGARLSAVPISNRRDLTARLEVVPHPISCQHLAMVRPNWRHAPTAIGKSIVLSKYFSNSPNFGAMDSSVS